MTRRIRYQVACSLDGFIAGPQGEYDWIVVDPEIDLTQAVYFTQGSFVAKRFVELDPLTDDDIEVFIDLVCRALAPR